ncbi:lactose-binding lectin l-2 [Amia ocellicauda]|uniref:lactose-binding lectin l-2 n=1 Tax=Amia ocellicauda TaxID=2972642 RepID=UPI0034639FDC
MALLQMSALLCTVLALSVASASVIEVDKRDSCQGSCAHGWTSFKNRCYQYFSDQKDWADAEGFCLSGGGNLASVHSEEEHTFLKQLIKKSDNAENPTWIGGTDCQKEGVWHWSDGTKWDFTKWNGGEPNNLNIENCLHMDFPAGMTGNWNDIACGNRYAFICVLRA